jgi:CheY-like chemotaxis protein
MLRGAGFAGASVLITGFGSKDLTERAEAFGFDLVLDKPVRPNQLLAISKAATRHP